MPCAGAQANPTAIAVRPSREKHGAGDRGTVAQPLLDKELFVSAQKGARHEEGRGALVGGLETPDAISLRAAERAAHVAEQLALEQSTTAVSQYQTRPAVARSWTISMSALRGR